MKYKINEIFASFQGEGLNTGRPAVFIRFSGCNLACPWCDTKGHESGEYMTVDEIMARVREEARSCDFKSPLVVITGGEPLLHDLHTLIDAVKTDKNLLTSVETNGTVYRPIPETVFVAVSPKPNSSPRTEMLARANEIKIVVDACEDDRLLSLAIAEANCHAVIWLQPEGNKADMVSRCEMLLQKSGDYRVRIGHQIHKMRGWK